MSNYLRLKKMLYVVALAAISIVLALIEIPWPLATYLKLDFSEVAILVALIVLGNKETLLVVLVRTITRRLFRGFEPADLVGEMLAVFASLSIIVGYNAAKRFLRFQERPLFYEVSVEKRKPTMRESIWTTLFITGSLSIILWAINFLVATPFYFSLFTGDIHLTVFTFVPASEQFTYGSFLWFTIITYFPFNIVKGILVSIVFLMIKPRLQYIEF